MSETYIFSLEKPARSSGGDRYEVLIPGEKPWRIYFPQTVSRPKGISVDSIKVTVTPEETE